MTRKLARRSSLILVYGHFVNDTFSFMISGLLPLFTAVFSLSYFLVGVIAMVFNLTSSVMQPLLGRWFDRHQAAWLIEAGLVVNCLGMSFVGISPNYVLVLLLVGTAGLGSAAFHPPAFSAVVKASGSSRGGKMAMFVSGGNTGVFVGPVVAGLLVSMLGRSGTLLMLPVGLITALMLFKIHFKHEEHQIEAQRKPANTRLIALLAAVTAFRSIAISSAIYFLPLYFIARGSSLFLSTAITSLWLGVGVLGQLGGGYLSDRIGQRVVIVVSLLLGGILFYGFLMTSGYTSLGLLVVSGAFLYASWAVIVVMSAEAAPSNIGAVSGFMLGFYVGIGGIAAAAFGALGDAFGLTNAFYVVAGSAFLGGLTALLLPKRIEHAVSV